ncbi:ATP-binding protein [Priestia megaterium]|uniref:ATP-binding protein n=1 Tax=Priestia megaterium TaxID=1404 RepID=UPI00300AE4A3
MESKNQLKQVFINIIKNSIEAMPEGGAIHITTKVKENHLWLQLADEGQGIPPERLAKIGEPFYSTKEKGTGLGLMVSYRIIKAHHAQMTFSSQLDKGTSVDILFPIIKK